MTASFYNRIRDAHNITKSIADQKRTLERQYSRLIVPLRATEDVLDRCSPVAVARIELDRLGLK